MFARMADSITATQCAVTPYYEQDGITIHHGDAREILAGLGSVDLVVTDPPYNVSLTSFNKAGGWGDLMNGAMFYAFILKESKRLTANRQGGAWLFNSWRSLPVLLKAAYEANWNPESCLVWDKEWIGPGGPNGLRPSYELALLFRHEGFRLANRGLPDIWRHKWASIKPTGHPAEKPVSLLSQIIQESGGGVVLDPFMGSGTALVAAKRLGESAIGIEIEERYCEMAANRLSQQVMSL